MIDNVPGLEYRKWVKPKIGFSRDDVYLIKKGFINCFEEKDVVVKISTRKEVVYEALNMTWLKKYCKVPEIHRYGMVKDNYYCMMEYLPGVMFQELLDSYDVKDVVKTYASLIRQFHDIDPVGLPHNHSLEQKLKHVEYCMEKQLINTDHFERELKQYTIEEIYQKIQTYLPIEEDLVLCHGDICMPNIMMNGLELSGYIDIVGIGVCDRHLDLAIGLRSLRYNLELYRYEFNQEVVDLFLETYGIKELEKEKVEFYILLDELTVG